MADSERGAARVGARQAMVGGKVHVEHGENVTTSHLLQRRGYDNFGAGRPRPDRTNRQLADPSAGRTRTRQRAPWRGVAPDRHLGASRTEMPGTRPGTGIYGCQSAPIRNGLAEPDSRATRPADDARVMPAPWRAAGAASPSASTCAERRVRRCGGGACERSSWLHHFIRRRRGANLGNEGSGRMT